MTFVERLVEDRRYESVMLVLAVLSVAVLLAEGEAWAEITNHVVWGVFAIDYFVRLALADDKRRFVRRNVLDLIAILPADLLRLARVARLARLARAGSLAWRSRQTVVGILRTNGTGVALLVAASVVALGAWAVWITDPLFESYGDAVWWAVVTSTTVGYGDLSPTTGTARGVAVVVMFVGIGTVGLLTASLANYFARPRVQNSGLSPIQVVYPDGRTVELDDETAAVMEILLARTADAP